MTNSYSRSTSIPNWFAGTESERNFERYTEQFIGKENLNFLEIGSFCGDSSVWMLKNVLTGYNSKLTCVDPWLVDVENLSFDWKEIENEFDKQTVIYSDKVLKYQNFSKDWLMNNRSILYDFIYIDGDHTGKAVIEDCVLSWDLLKLNGVMAFDDYEWNHPEPNETSPKIAVDLFLQTHKNEIELIHKGWQVWVRKIKAA